MLKHNSPLTRKQFLNILELFELPNIHKSDARWSIPLNDQLTVTIKTNPNRTHTQTHFVHRDPETRCGVGFYFSYSDALKLINDYC